MKKFIQLLKPDIKKIVLTSVLLLLSVLSSLALPTLLSEIIDNGINKRNFDFVWKVSLIMLGITAVGVVTTIIATRLMAAITTGYSRRLKDLIFKKANTLTYDTINKIGVSSLLTRSTEDTWVVTMMAGGAIRNIITLPVLLIGGAVLAFLRDWSLALIMFLSVPLLVFLLIMLSKKTMPLWDKVDKYIDIQNAIIKERMTGIRVIRAFNKEEAEMEKAKVATNVMADNIIKANLYMGLLPPISILSLNIIVVLIYYIGAIKMRTPGSSLSAGNIVSVIEYMALAMVAVMNMGFIFAFLPKVKVSYRRIREVLESEGIPEITENDKKPLKGAITFKDVGLTYPSALAPAVCNLNFVIKPGDKVAFIGGTGSGKTTIINLLMGFFNNTEGSILFDDIEISDISVHRRRHNISCVLQKSNIFSGTIKSNVLMGEKSATEKEVLEVLEIAQLSDFISEQKLGINYEIQPKGSNLSGGQKQRLSIARALLKKAPIYIFDDSFSALDFLTESKIRKKLNEKISDKTQIYITQRVASAMNCDCIYVLENGKIIASGTHNELINSCKIYEEIYLSQTGGSING